MAPRSIRTLLDGIVDYAGLFPPADLGMAEAVRSYASHMNGTDAWALGRFVVPASRLGEFQEDARLLFTRSSVWRLSALAGPDLRNDLRTIDGFNAGQQDQAVVDTIETRASSVDDIRNISSAVPSAYRLYIEIPVQRDPALMVQALRRAGRCAKIRTGGVTAEAFPATRDLARVLDACVKEHVMFKATAGLHHPLRSVYHLTYKPDSERGTMFGYLNVFLAAAFLRNGMEREHAILLLEEESLDAFVFSDDGVSWRDHRVDTAALQATRLEIAHSFGSCSFREPIDDLTAMKLL